MDDAEYVSERDKEAIKVLDHELDRLHIDLLILENIYSIYKIRTLEKGEFEAAIKKKQEIILKINRIVDFFIELLK